MRDDALGDLHPALVDDLRVAQRVPDRPLEHCGTPLVPSELTGVVRTGEHLDFVVGGPDDMQGGGIDVTVHTRASLLRDRPCRPDRGRDG